MIHNYFLHWSLFYKSFSLKMNTVQWTRATTPFKIFHFGMLMVQFAPPLDDLFSAMSYLFKVVNRASFRNVHSNAFNRTFQPRKFHCGERLWLALNLRLKRVQNEQQGFMSFLSSEHVIFWSLSFITSKDIFND